MSETSYLPMPVINKRVSTLGSSKGEGILIRHVLLPVSTFPQCKQKSGHFEAHTDRLFDDF